MRKNTYIPAISSDVGQINALGLEAGSPWLYYTSFDEYEWTFLLAPGLVSAVLALSNRLAKQTKWLRQICLSKGQAENTPW